ncbi:WG repeat-containing protein [Flammeovirga aprica]|uniref:WG repeat-containing protein n=1 Tax=Flammeovirga aprica JL-4 TaxID=694437 RepID=A0A7X9RST2_9BACT|nr:WG repeat-containing protein [Flammeovirga aprica]NME66379.1 WG repeat-containing protein [Flammeovirga aprica JL-4]
MKFYFLLLLFYACTNSLFAQNVKTFWKLLDKGEYIKIEKKIQKEKDSETESAVLQSNLGLYFFHVPKVSDLDSAYYYFQSADTLWSDASEGEKNTWAKSYVTEDSIKNWIKEVEKAGFDHSLEEMTEQSFAAYIQKFPHALHIPRAIELRDSLGFENAKKEHSYNAYEVFVRTYPEAKQAKEAQHQYELLVYHSKTKDADEKVLAQFLLEHPENKYRNKVEGQLYAIRTENRSKSDYEQFIRDYPNSVYADSAISHLWYFSTSKDSLLVNYPSWSEKDYYQSLIKENDRLFPVCRENEVVFIKGNGEVDLEGEFVEASKDYNCHGTAGAYFEVTKERGTGWVDRKGKEVVACQYDEIVSLEEGLVSVKKNGKYGIYALNEGEWMPTIYDQVLRVSNRLFGVRKKARWGVISLEGEIKFPVEAGQLIHISDNMVLVMKKGRWASYRESDIFENNISTTDSTFKFEGYKLLKDQWYALSEEGKWSIYSPNGKRWSKGAAFDEIRDTADEQGWLVRKDTLWQLINYDMEVKIDSMIQPVLVKGKGVISKWNDQWVAYQWNGNKISEHDADTLSFINQELDLLIEKEKQHWVKFQSGKSLSLQKYSDWNITHIRKDSLNPAFLSVKSKRNKRYALLNENGSQIMTPQFSKLNIYKEGVVTAKYGTLEYLYALNGKKIYNEGYASIQYDDGVFHLKSKGKYGLYVPDSSFKIPPMFDQPLERTHLKKEGEQLWMGKKAGKYGLLTLSNAKTTKLYYEKMKPINNGLAFVWEDEKWKLLDVVNNTIALECDSYELFALSDDQFWIRYVKKNKFGIYTSSFGDVIFPEFEAVENMGDSESPLFMGMQYIHQAKLNILLYMDLRGKVVFQSILKENQYRKIKCE